jgi:hypothetical protein
MLVEREEHALIRAQLSRFEVNNAVSRKPTAFVGQISDFG